ncbi:MAG: response regulator transcription factor [Chloroflexota bacterium]|nr:response regulator transcription factor [Chloroflexota bacterium]
MRVPDAAADQARKIRILICDDHEIVRQGLRALLDEEPTFDVVADVATAADAVSASHSLQPDVVIMDVRLPDATGIEACREIRQERPDVRVLMLTSYPDTDAVISSIVAGARGFLLKEARAEVFVDAIRRVSAGESLLDPAVTAPVFERMRRLPSFEDPGFASLTEQERRILNMIAEGGSNREIADAMFLSEKTVKNYVSHILGKLDLRRRSEAAAYMARRRHWYEGKGG